MKKNIDVRKAIKNAGVKYWEIADSLGMYDGNFSRKLRKELSQQEKNEIFKIIEKFNYENEMEEEDEKSIFN
jgi:hypothetical protein